MKKDLYFYGQINDDFLDFEIGIDYGGFLILEKTVMKTKQNKLIRQSSLVEIDKNLDKLSDKILFSKKLEKANTMRKTAKSPIKK